MEGTKTATEELRALLDARGVEWQANDSDVLLHTIWRNQKGQLASHLEVIGDEADGWYGGVSLYGATPAQAVEATLGRGECELAGLADVKFTVEYEVEGYDASSSTDYATLAECSSCGAFVIVPPAFHHVLTCDGEEVFGEYAYCPACGKAVGR